MTISLDWQPKLYDANHNYISKFGIDLVSLLGPKENQKILDVGCGTAVLTNLIAQSGADVIGLDSSIHMLEEAKTKYPKLNLVCKSVAKMDYTNQFDGIFSNASLHFVLEPEIAVSCMSKALKKNGKLVIELGAKGNVHNIESTLKNVLINTGFGPNTKKIVWYFPTLAQYCSILEQHGFEIEYATTFKRFTKLIGQNGMADWIKQFGVFYFKNMFTNQVEEIVKQMLNSNSQLWTTNYVNGAWHADYVRLRIIATKK